MKETLLPMYNQEIIDKIRDVLLKKKKCISVAESVTSGHMQAALSGADNASEFFQGGITTYNAGQKCRHLGVDPLHAELVNSVSAKVAAEMAIGANRMFLSDYAMSITGYATKIPELGIEKLFAFFAIAQNEKVVLSKRITSTKRKSADVQVDYTNQVLTAMKKMLNKG